ncbi:hypothetical protein RchiOBHm_Chr6g0295781 [Rosa chinensis]|uniref:Uncharacterized protein n=1 Tax=Rosa chinensis TaxID=74649 RepID=A0A2P6PXC9_ROSCH|nr:hypothetical protein RchiOBHm_Chr6g0295781 [Rosa chinensis]
MNRAIYFICISRRHLFIFVTVCFCLGVSRSTYSNKLKTWQQDHQERVNILWVT